MHALTSTKENAKLSAINFGKTRFSSVLSLTDWRRSVTRSWKTTENFHAKTAYVTFILKFSNLSLKKHVKYG